MVGVKELIPEAGIEEEQRVEVTVLLDGKPVKSLNLAGNCLVLAGLVEEVCGVVTIDWELDREEEWLSDMTLGMAWIVGTLSSADRWELSENKGEELEESGFTLKSDEDL